MLQKFTVLPPALEPETHFLDTVLDRVRNVQGVIYSSKMRQITVHSQIQEQILSQQCRLGRTTKTHVTDVHILADSRIQHLVVHDRCQVFFTLLAVHQLDECDKLQSKVTGHIAFLMIVVNITQVIFYSLGYEGLFKLCRCIHS